MTINFKQNKTTTTYCMMPFGTKAAEWAPLILAAGSIDCLLNTDPEITAILREVAFLFDPTPSIIDTDFSHQLRLTTDQPIHARIRRYSLLEVKILKERIKELYQSGYARPSIPPYSANPLIVPKADASAFSTSDRHHEFLVMPQGMSNSSATFQRNIDCTLRECIDGGYCAAFADDILVYSKRKTELLRMNIKPE
ncbi:hypothetical protein BB561_005058 [Smittium simulii]|uniref:Reverse transcriptase domain-containing protein n=1 Tax=Smittium simulii TaxID=133385 RepID=A0A2T9YCI5_9FUNG|nr:hypothetical protein BB561_005058 [Smittium simulii]